MFGVVHVKVLPHEHGGVHRALLKDGGYYLLCGQEFYGAYRYAETEDPATCSRCLRGCGWQAELEEELAYERSCRRLAEELWPEDFR